jgi:hypothetical protein
VAALLPVLLESGCHCCCCPLSLSGFAVETRNEIWVLCYLYVIL